MFVSLNIYKRFGVLLRNIMELFEVDKGHPFNFSKYSISSLIQKSGFEILSLKTGDYRAQKRRYRESKKSREKIWRKKCLYGSSNKNYIWRGNRNPFNRLWWIWTEIIQNICSNHSRYHTICLEIIALRNLIHILPNMLP